MTQNASDVEIANQGFAAFRQDLNDVLEDITTLHSGTAAPSTTYANQWWYETDTDKLYIRNEDNDAWIEILTLDQANDKLASLGVILHIDDTGSTKQLEIQAPNTVNNHTQLRFNSQYYQYWDITNDAGELKFGRGGSDHAIIDSGGRLLVGTTAAAYSPIQLHLGDTSSSQSGVQIQSSTTGLGYVLFGDGSAADAYRGQINYSHSADSMAFNTAGSERMRILSSGCITFNGDSAAANALDDYEEGTHVSSITPQSSGSITLDSGANTLSYVKVGSIVHVSGILEVGSVSSATGFVKISLPFAVKAGNAYRAAANVKMNSLVSNAISDAWGIAEQSLSVIDLYMGDAISVRTDTAEQMTSSTSLRIQVTYQTS